MQKEKLLGRKWFQIIISKIMKTLQQNTSLFSIALGLESPWYVAEVKLLDKPESSSKELHIYVNFRRCHEFVL